jgi:hypothetical protein
MNKLLREERLQIMLADEELTAVDDWRFDKRMPSRAAAIRELLRRGLAAEGYSAFDGRSKSKEFGVVDSPMGESAAEHPEGNGAGSDVPPPPLPGPPPPLRG